MKLADLLAPSMGFVFEPRALATQRRAFGMSSIPLTPTESTDATSARWRAVQLQHQVANTVRENLAARGTNLSAWVADRSEHESRGLSYDRLIRIQRGETMMQLTDLLHWAAVFPAVAQLLSAWDFEGSSADTSVADAEPPRTPR